MKQRFYSSLLLFHFWLLFSSLLSAQEAEKKVESPADNSITVDLRHPVIRDGVITTEEGGVVSAPNLRIQARRIVYTNKVIDGLQVTLIEAEGDLILDFGKYLLVGDRLEYNFQTKTGLLYGGRAALPPWYFGGEVIKLNPDGSFEIIQAFVTTSEDRKTEWEISAEEASISNEKFLRARDIRIQILHHPIFWLPAIKADLKAIFDSPLRYHIRWGGRQRTCFGIIYELVSLDNFKTFLHLDYRIKRGFGGGLHIEYRSDDKKTYCETINYIAKDSSADDIHEQVRFRFQGYYHKDFEDDKTALEFTWDKLSDKDMATDYDDRGIELDLAGRTQLDVRHQEDWWIANFVTKVRVNSFQTVKQELPNLAASFRPYTLGSTGIIAESQFKTAYLDFEYTKHQPNVHGYHSSRFEISHLFYRPFTLGPFKATPEAGGFVIYYGNSPSENPRWLLVGRLGCELNAYAYRSYPFCRHVLKPYLRYDYLSMPTSSPHQHYIFDINDGWFRLNTVRFGLSQSLYLKNLSGLIGRSFNLDIFANAFFDTPTIPAFVPKLYSTLTWRALPTLMYTFSTAWDFPHNQLDHFNLRTAWTISEDMALAIEYRHRDAYDWRKVDKSNFIIDSFRSINQLYHSQLSDRRDTILCHLFYRIKHNLAVEFESRHGWNRRHQPNYNEYELDILTTIRSTLNLKFTFQHKENERNDDRIAVYFSFGMKRPDRETYENFVPCVEY